MYKQTSFRARTGQGDKTDPVDITMGVLQGDSLSPLLFSILLSDIIEFFKKKGHRNIEKDIDMLLFADDLTILATNIVDLQDKLNTLERYCKIKGLMVNTTKSKILVFNKSGKLGKFKSIKYNGLSLEFVRDYTYLGVVFSASGLFKLTLEKSLLKGKSALGAIWQILTAGRINNWTATLRLYSTMVASTVLYGSGMWALNHMHEVEKIQTLFLKRLLQLPNSTPGYVLRLESGTTRIDRDIVKRALMFWVKVSKMGDTRYPKIMLHRLKNLDSSCPTPDKRNWLTALRIILENHNYSQFLLLENEKLILDLIPSITEMMKTASFKEDVRRAYFSTFCPLYKGIKDLSTLNREPYLNTPLPTVFIRFFANCRLAGSLMLNFRFNKILYKTDIRENCQICNMNTRETLYHIMIDCPIYADLRTRFLANRGVIDILTSTEKEDMAGLYYYLTGILKKRSFILNDCY